MEIFERFPKLSNGPRVDKDSLVVQQQLPGSALADVRAPRIEVSSWRLWRGMAPPSLPSRDIVVLGLFFALQHAVRCEIGSIWAYAYMYDELTGPLDSMTKPSTSLDLVQRIPVEKQLAAAQKGEFDDITYDAALFNRFGKRRTPNGYGSRNPDVVFEGGACFDPLLQDLGLRSWRNGWGWLGKIFGGNYDQADFQGLVEEWMEKQKEKK